MLLHRSVNTGLLQVLMTRELQARYRGSIAGALWLLLHPILLLGVYTLVFGVVFRATLPAQDALSSVPYIAYVALGLWPWLAFSEAVSRGIGSVQNQGALVKKVSFPSTHLVIATVLASFAVHGVGALLVLIVLAAFGIPLHISGLPVYACGFVALIVPALGLAFALSALQVFVRDVEQVMTQLLTIAFYATPVLYSTRMLPEWLQQAVQYNPIGQLIEPMRAAVLGAGVSNAPGLWISLAGFALLFLAGHWIFGRLSRHFEDAL